MFGSGKKERKVQDSISEHVIKVGKCVEEFYETIEAYVKGDMAAAKEISYQVHLTESDADCSRRKIIQLLYKGAFMPINREGLILLVGNVDKIADHAESCADFLISQKPEIPEEFKESVMKLARDSVDCFKPLKEAIDNLFGDLSVLQEQCKKVNVLEEEVDADEWKTTKVIFGGKLPLANKMHLRELVWHISEISDVCEDAADSLEVITVKNAF
ncbi:TIGR00153 family protein [bacterium]|nr:TIGR00153 family protein [bacterium]MBU3954888.1 TIGR00153 family protein [bacterium]